MSQREYEIVIGLETHVQLCTASKIFCDSSAKFGAGPNEHIDPVTLGLPGALPVVNEGVIESAIKLGLAMSCEIRRESIFARKHYFYPDLPKGYQISQFEEPICERGSLSIRCEEVTRAIGITRIHMEEDAGKSIHDRNPEYSYIDLNRAGVPLLEVVTEPDIRSAAEAGAFLRSLRQLVRWLSISDGNMEEGSLRCDANISLRPRGELTFGTRTEVKNLNSFRFVERAIEYEVARQLKIIKSGANVEQQTLLYDADRDCTFPMRGKEESADYRYFPDPDLPPVIVEESKVRAVQNEMPVLPAALRMTLVKQHGLSDYDAEVLTSEKEYADYYFKALEAGKNGKLVCNWITSELFGALNKKGIPFTENPIPAQHLGALVGLIEANVISGKIAKSVFEELFTSTLTPEEIVKERGLEQITDPAEIQRLVKQVMDENPDNVKAYLEGNQKVLGFFVGQVMKLSKGSANPKLVNEILQEALQNADARE
ncbi:MAG: Asp-tRNA(Asn)/Glu-tRNA(Gln) amidotransferase subunit GatB [Bdellovibrionales bacterium]|nr:Asp-tRNA(Asn)/Glu-tRNA(Gln) amidotransferase subunit GatB [Bdellovibrionales bacterium]